MCAFGQASRSALRAGKVRMKSPIAPPRMTRTQFILYCSGAMSAETIVSHGLGGHRPPLQFLILPEREGKNHTAIDQGESMQTAPAKNAPCTPVDLIAKDVRDCDPE